MRLQHKPHHPDSTAQSQSVHRSDTRVLSSQQARISAEVCYAKPDTQTLLSVTLPPGATVLQAIQASGILSRHPEIDLTQQKVGLYGRVSTLDAPVNMHDRVEIYRPLQADPKIARQQRVARSRTAARESRKWQQKVHPV